MSSLTTYSIRLKPGEDLKESLIQLAKEKKLSAPFILTCCGSVSSATIRFAKPKTDLGKERVQTFEEYFEICSLVGTLADGGHLHVVLGRQDGSTISGHVMGNMKIYTTAEIVIGNCDAFTFHRTFDSSTGFDELCISE